MDFNTFNQFLLKYKGCIFGSLGLACFDNKVKINDMDIFISHSNSREIYKALLECFYNPQVITVDKEPIDDPYDNENKHHYFYKFYIDDTKRGTRIHIIDLIIGQISFEQFLSFRDIKGINYYWLGNQWIWDYLPLYQLYTRKITLQLGLYGNNMGLVSEPFFCNYDEEQTLFSTLKWNKCYQALGNLPVTWINIQLQKIFENTNKNYVTVKRNIYRILGYNENIENTLVLYFLIKLLMRLVTYGHYGYKCQNLHEYYNNEKFVIQSKLRPGIGTYTRRFYSNSPESDFSSTDPNPLGSDLSRRIQILQDRI